MVGAITIRSLAKHYGTFKAVDDIDLDIAEGSFVSILGPSGCGKTTTLRMLAGFITPTNGSIAVDNVKVSSRHQVTAPEFRDMGMVFQSYAVWPHMTVADNVAYGLRYGRKRIKDSKARKTKVDEVLELVGLGGQQQKFPNALSGGQQQRVALARAIVTEPKILLLDEPLSNLDAKLRHDMRLELRRLQQRIGITTVLVTHSQDEALLLSDHLVVMNAGKIVEAGNPQQLYRLPRSRFVAEFLGSVNVFEAKCVSTDASGHAVFKTPLGILSSNASSGVRPGDQRVVGIRPEAIHLSRNPLSEARANLLFGYVTEGNFAGNLIDYAVTIGAVDLKVQQLSSSPLTEGEEVSLHVSRNDVLVLSS